MASKYLQITNYHIHVEVTRKRVNRVVGLGLEILEISIFYGDAKVLTCVKNSIGKISLCQSKEMCRIKTCMCFLFPQLIK